MGAAGVENAMVVTKKSGHLDGFLPLLRIRARARVGIVTRLQQFILVVFDTLHLARVFRRLPQSIHSQHGIVHELLRIGIVLRRRQLFCQYVAPSQRSSPPYRERHCQIPVDPPCTSSLTIWLTFVQRNHMPVSLTFVTSELCQCIIVMVSGWLLRRRLHAPV
jgi:hypothetical protein